MKWLISNSFSNQPMVDAVEAIPHLVIRSQVDTRGMDARELFSLFNRDTGYMNSPLCFLSERP